MSRTPLTRRLHPAIAATCGLALGITGIGLVPLSAAAVPTGAPTPGPTAVDSGADVTLITGDRVRVTTFTDGRQSVEVTPADADGGVQTLRSGGDLLVVPQSALPYLASGALDPDLFNVSKLIEYGYDDAHVAATPVIVQLAQPNARSRAVVPGLALERTLTSIGGAAGAVAHDEAASTWASLTAPAAATFRAAPVPGALSGGIAAIHLDGKVKATLDSSVPFIHAPEAWEQGYTGEGVTVAVLDTGYDDTHPDLQGRVLPGAQSFVPASAVDTDVQGHGTHVAATIAGTGAASDGTHRGVADGADLLIGKVLGDDGYGQDSWIIAGMEWAAHNADIVSMSLGSIEPSDGLDVMSAALDELSDETVPSSSSRQATRPPPRPSGRPGPPSGRSPSGRSTIRSETCPGSRARVRSSDRERSSPTSQDPETTSPQRARPTARAKACTSR